MKKFFAFAIMVGGFAFAANAQTATTAQQPAPTKSCCKSGSTASTGCSKSGAQSTAATPAKACCKSGATAAATPTKSCCKSGSTASSCNKTAATVETAQATVSPAVENKK